MTRLSQRRASPSGRRSIRDGRPLRGSSRRRGSHRIRTLSGLAIVAAISLAAVAVLTRSVGPGPAPGIDYVGPRSVGMPVRQPPDIDPAWYGAAPYVMPMTASAPDLASVAGSTGQRTFQLAFILANGSTCSPAWDGRTAVGPDNYVAIKIDALRARGGDVSVSFGGGLGTRLGQICRDAEQTADAYQEVIDRYHLRAVDFDLEDPEWRDDAAVAKELGAAAILKARNDGLYVAITLPMLQKQVPARAIHVLETARSVGFVPDNVSVMPFDFHGQPPMGKAAIEALEAMHGQLVKTFGWTSAEAYRREGVSLMNGRTDHGEFFMPADFRTVLDYAVSHDLGRFTYWSLNRDRQCGVPDNNGKTSGACSSVEQEALEFTTYTARFGASRATAPRKSP